MSSSRVARRDVAWMTALLLIVSGMWIVRGDRADAGVSPPGDGIDVVYVAVASNFPDSLGVGPGAGAMNAPILIVPTNPPLPSSIAAELVRLDPKKVVIIGGTAAISTAMQDALESLLVNATFERLAGANRYDTNAMFSAATFPIEDWVAVSAPAFTEDDDATTYSIDTSAYDKTLGTLYASISLPHGAEILEVKGIGYDVSGGSLSVTLGRSGQSNTESIATATSSTTAGDTSFSTTSITSGREIVDNQNWVYWISAGLTDSNRAIYGVMVRYRLGAPGA